MDYGCSKDMPPNDERQLLWAQQRQDRGFDDTETWGLNITIAQFIVPRLKTFRELRCCYPVGITSEEWDDILRRMIEGFEEIAKDQTWKMDDFKANMALELFKEWFWDLWW